MPYAIFHMKYGIWHMNNISAHFKGQRGNMRKRYLPIAVTLLVVLVCPSPVRAQVTASDILFSRLSTTTSRMAYEQRGGDMKEIAPLLEEAGKLAASDPAKSYRTFMKAAVLMNGVKWTPDAELATALDFSLNVKAVGPGERLQAQRSEEH